MPCDVIGQSSTYQQSYDAAYTAGVSEYEKQRESGASIEDAAKAAVIAGASAAGIAACAATGVGTAISPLCGIVAGFVADWLYDEAGQFISDLFSDIAGGRQEPEFVESWDIRDAEYQLSNWIRSYASDITKLQHQLGVDDLKHISTVLAENDVFAMAKLSSSYDELGYPRPISQEDWKDFWENFVEGHIKPKVKLIVVNEILSTQATAAARKAEQVARQKAEDYVAEQMQGGFQTTFERETPMAVRPPTLSSEHEPGKSIRSATMKAVSGQKPNWTMQEINDKLMDSVRPYHTDEGGWFVAWEDWARNELAPYGWGGDDEWNLYAFRMAANKFAKDKFGSTSPPLLSRRSSAKVPEPTYEATSTTGASGILVSPEGIVHGIWYPNPSGRSGIVVSPAGIQHNLWEKQA